MRRGEIWTAAGNAEYAGKPRPAVVIQADQYDATDSVTVCPFTTDAVVAPDFRIVVEASGENGLQRQSSLMADKLLTMPRAKLGRRVGRLSDQDLARLNSAIIVFLGLAN